MDKALFTIIGIDPGTTVGFALLSLDGRKMATGSRKEYKISDLISDVVSHGSVLIVGCDKKRIPDFVKQFAVKTGAVIVRPDHDLLTSEKKALVGAIKTKNSHEHDALAAAKMAHKEYSSLLKRMRKAIKPIEDKEQVRQIIRLVVKDGLNIQEAINICTPEEKKQVQAKKTVIVPVNVDKLRRNLEKEQKNAAYLKKTVRRLRKERNMLEKKERASRERLRNSYKKGLREKEIKKRQNIIQKLANRIVRMEKKQKILEREKTDLMKFITQTNTGLLGKRVNTLSKQEWKEKKKLFLPTAGDIMYVDNPGVFSMETLRDMATKINLIVTEGNIPKPLQEQTLIRIIQVKGCTKSVTKNFVLLDQEMLKEQKKDLSYLKNIVMAYKKRRKIDSY